MANLSSFQSLRHETAGTNACLILALSCLAPAVGAGQDEVTEGLPQQALVVLHGALRTEQRWIKVHAAEALLEVGSPEGVLETFREELALHGDAPAYRIGIWRVLARASTPQESQQWIERIRTVFLDEAAPDRVHAVESLAKLRYKIDASEQANFWEAARSENSGLAIFALWALAASPEQDSAQIGQCRDALAQKLASAQSIARLRAAIVLSRLPKLSASERTKLYEVAKRTETGSLEFAYLVSAAYLAAVNAGDNAEAAECRIKLSALARHEDPEARRAVCVALAEASSAEASSANGVKSRSASNSGPANDLTLVTDLLRDDDADVQVAASYAVLRIRQRTEFRARVGEQ